MSGLIVETFHWSNRSMNKNVCKICILSLMVCLLEGCASTPAREVIGKNEPIKNEAVIPPAVKEPATKSPVKTSRFEGIIFGKADFRGILKADYVKLNIIDEGRPEKQYELLFGDRDENNDLTWDANPIEPHYFFLELPAGKYRISSISIPVGTTLATESADIAFIVEKETVIYLGTLQVTGTDQKIRFGWVPLIRPGFDYRVEIINEKEEAINKFKVKYPKLQRDIQVKLMKALRIQAF